MIYNGCKLNLRRESTFSPGFILYS